MDFVLTTVLTPALSSKEREETRIFEGGRMTGKMTGSFSGEFICAHLCPSAAKTP
jgi:hypothetical protein